MTTKIMNNETSRSADRADQQHENNNLKTRTKTNDTFIKTVTENKSVPQEDEREFFIQYFMKENQVTREVAAAKYDFLS